MGNLRITGLLVAVLALACNDAAPVPPGDPFVGRWSCADTRTLTFTTPAGSPDATAKSSFVLTIATSSSGQLTTYAQAEAGAPCSLKFDEKGMSATLGSGQTCATADGIMLTYKTGTADLGAASLQANLAFDFAGMLQMTGGAAPLDATGTGTTSSLCYKIIPPPSSGPPGGGGW